jgi:hypothetical protein
MQKTDWLSKWKPSNLETKEVKGFNVLVTQSCRNKRTRYFGRLWRWSVMDKQELIDILDVMLGPALIGALDDDEIVREYGNLGLDIVRRGRRLLHQAKEGDDH